MSDLKREEFDAWFSKRVQPSPSLNELAWEAFQAGWKAGVQNREDGKWDYE